jgi:membrane protease YdiL (CAAX protease family)
MMNITQDDQKSPGILGKILHFPLLVIIIGVILVNVPTFIMRSVAQFILSSLSIENNIISAIVIFVVRLLTVYFAYIFFVHIFEKRKAKEISINFVALIEVSLGGLLGLGMIVIVILLMWCLGNLTVNAINIHPTLLYHSFFAFLQDVVYFAIIFRITEKSLGSWSAIVVASIIFGFKHLLFPGYTLWSVVAQTFEAGILFSALFILSRRIWLIFGFHVAWNFVQYGLIQGFDAERLIPLFRAEFPGSRLITGMPVGFEASLITFILGTIFGLYLLIKVYQKGNFILPFWKKVARTN